MTKAEIRKEIKERIGALPEAELKANSNELCKLIINSKDYIRSSTILAYMPLPDEADITDVIQDALAKEKKVFLPRIFPGTTEMEFYRYTKDSTTSKGDFGITEPAPDTQTFTKFLEQLSIQQYSPAANTSNYVNIDEHNDPEEHILVLVPGRAFTRGGKRIGRGKGFYDIYFSKVPLVFDIKKFGVCLDCQLMTDLPTTPDDILMDRMFIVQSES